MEVTKYLCEFFFTNFWHWLGLVVILAIVFRFGIVSFGNNNWYNSFGNYNWYNSFGNKFTEVNHGNKQKED